MGLSLYLAWNMVDEGECSGLLFEFSMACVSFETSRCSITRVVQSHHEAHDLFTTSSKKKGIDSTRHRQPESKSSVTYNYALGLVWTSRNNRDLFSQYPLLPTRSPLLQ